MSCTKCNTTVPEKRPAGYEAGARRLLCTLAQHSNAPGLVLAHHLCHEGLEVIDGLLALLQQPSLSHGLFLGRALSQHVFLWHADNVQENCGSLRALQMTLDKEDTALFDTAEGPAKSGCSPHQG